MVGGRLVGWARRARREYGRQALRHSERIALERRARLIDRLGHKLRSALLVLQESVRQAAFGRPEMLEQVYEQAQEAQRRAAALTEAASEPKDSARAVALAAVVDVGAPGAARKVPGDATVSGPEGQLVEALSRAYEWMGGPGSSITGEKKPGWWRLEIAAADGRPQLTVPELGEPLVRLLVEGRLGGWVELVDQDRIAIYLPAHA
jgi:hypothetical protein